MIRKPLAIRYIPKNFNRCISIYSKNLQKSKENSNIDKVSFEGNHETSNNKIMDQQKDFIQKLLTRPKQIKNKPFIKNLFCGEYMYEYLKFPEYEHNLQIQNLDKNFIQPVKEFFHSSNYNKIINKNGNFSLDAFNKFRNLNLFSSFLPKEFNGEEVDSTGVTRILEETGIYPSLGIGLIYNNELAGKSILLYGNKDQKNNYLKRIANGELKACFCYSEPENGYDASRFNLIAKVDKKDLTTNKQTFILNGKKSWISLLIGDDLEKENVILIVISKTLDYDSGEEAKSLNTFIIDKNTPGVEIKKVLNNENGLNLFEVDFKDVRCSSDDLLGAQGAGFEISNKITENSRFLIGAICIGLLKNFFKETVEFAILSRRFGKSLSEFPLIKNKIAKIETKIYTMESMTYLTAGILDSYEQPDIGCEAALTKIYCTETLKECVNICLEIMSMGGYTKLDKVKNKYLSDLSYLSNSLNSNDVLRLYVATNGLVLAGAEFGEELSKVRNPFKYPGFVIRQILINHRLVRSAQKKVPEYFYLWEHVHPSLKYQVGMLEQSAVKFMMAAKSTIINHGRDVIDSQVCLIELSDICMHLYALNCVIARASRSYSIGLKNSQHEVALSLVQCEESTRIINELHSNIIKARSGESLENTKMNIADKVLKLKQHAASHSIDRNY